MRDMGSRDRVLGDMDVLSPNCSSVADSSSSVPATRRISMMQKKVDFDMKDDSTHPVDFKGYKSKKQFKPSISSTNPSYPKIHANIDPPASL